MKILFGMPSIDSWGGPAACEPPFVEALRNDGFDVAEETYVYGDKEKPTPTHERVSRVVRSAWRLRKAMLKADFDVVHLNTSFDLRTILRDAFTLFLMPNGAKIFLKMHGSNAPAQQNAGVFVKRLIRYLQQRADGVGVLSLEERKDFVDLGFSPEKVFTVKNVVSLGDQDPKDLKRIQKPANANFELLFVARFIATKGLIETIRACSILRDRGYRFTLSCVGDGEIRSEAESVVRESGLAEQVEFTGYLPEYDVTKFFLKSDIFILPTSFDGFPIVLFKAIAAGMAVVTTPIRAAADLLTDRQNCLFCTNNVEDIADKIAELIDNVELREEMSETNIEFGSTLKPDKIAAQYVDVYTAIMENTKRGR